jgi:hypothetical protein
MDKTLGEMSVITHFLGNCHEPQVSFEKSVAIALVIS